MALAHPPTRSANSYEDPLERGATGFEPDLLKGKKNSDSLTFIVDFSYIVESHIEYFQGVFLVSTDGGNKSEVAGTTVFSGTSLWTIGSAEY